jgi:hypothetical protein
MSRSLANKDSIDRNTLISRRALENRPYVRPTTAWSNDVDVALFLLGDDLATLNLPSESSISKGFDVRFRPGSGRSSIIGEKQSFTGRFFRINS